MPAAAAQRSSASRPRPSAVWANGSARSSEYGHAVGAEHLLDERRVARRVAEDHGHVAGRGAAAQQLEHARGRQLDLGPRAAGRVEGDRVAGLHRRRRLGLEQAALHLVQGGARAGRVVLVHRRQLASLRRRARTAARAPSAVARNAARPGSNGQRHDHVRAAAHRQRLERVELELGEVVEAVDEDAACRPSARAPAAARRARARRTARGPRGRRPRARGGSRRRSPPPRPRRRRRGPSPAHARSACVKRPGSTRARPSSATSRAAARTKPGRDGRLGEHAQPRPASTLASSSSSRCTSEATGSP